MTPARALLAAVLLNAGLGTFYAWSVFITPYEAVLDTSRSGISAVFSLATVCFVAAMLLGPLLHARLSAARLALLSTGIGALGLALAGWAPSLGVVFAGYGVLFGTANGLGYGLALQVISRSFERRRALAMGLVVAAYAAGAAAAAPILAGAVRHFGLTTALYALAATILVFGTLATLLLQGAPHLTQPPQANSHRLPSDPPACGRLFTQMWIAYALGASAGLMMIGHAIGIVEASGGSAETAVVGPILVSVGNGVGRISAGYLGDILPVQWVLTSATGLGAGALLVNCVAPSPVTALAAVAVMGGAYGILAAGYPVAVAQYFGPDRVAAVYGRLFTAWGAGGIVGPFVAAHAFDTTGGYRTAMIAASAAAIIATACTAWLPRQRSATRTGPVDGRGSAITQGAPRDRRR